MFGQSRNSHALSANVRELDRRLRSMEQGVRRSGTRARSSAGNIAEHSLETVVSALGSLADRFRGLSIGDDASKYRSEAMQFGNDALRRVSREVAQRPLVTLAVAVSVGLLLGLAFHRR
jgi:ElaB/YqjD/DUF883 family membrane-anchored ribosome-binding protein